MLIPVADTWPKWWSVAYVMMAQAISGIAKDLNKMSAKSAIRVVVPETPDDHSRGENQLFQWVAILTGSKNALKGVGFFLGGALLTTIGFNAAVGAMAAGLFLAFLMTLVLPGDIGRMKQKPAFAALFSKSKGINVLSLARFFLFGARDVWFVVALPVFLQAALGWKYWEAGGFMGLWVIGYGIVQGSAPALRRAWGQVAPPGVALVVGLAVFGVVFAINSSIQSYKILAYSDAEAVSLNVGFYYMANAAGRLVGTLLSGAMFLVGGMQACLWTSSALVAAAYLVSTHLPAPPRQLQATS
jgi:hypothetical protein